MTFHNIQGTFVFTQKNQTHLILPREAKWDIIIRSQMRTLTHSVSSATVPRPHKLVEDLDLEDMSPEQLLCSALSPGENCQLNGAYPFLLWFPGSSSERIISGLFFGNIYLFICLYWVSGSPQDLQSSLQHAGSFVAACELQLQHVRPSCLTREWPWAPCIGSVLSSYWTTREVLYMFLSSAHLFFFPWSWTLLFFFSYFPGHSSLFLLKFYPYFILWPLQTTWTHLYKR